MPDRETSPDPTSGNDPVSPTGTPARPSRHADLLAALRRRDPDLVSLRRAVRVGIAFPLLAVLGVVVLESPEVAVFGPIGAMAYLVFAAFDGTTRTRVVANLLLWPAGAVAITIGTLVEDSVVSAAVTVALATFWLRWLGCVGGRIGGGAPAVLLVLVVAVLTPGGPEQLAARQFGWLLAAVVCTLVATFVLPVHPHRAIRRALATIFDDLADRTEAAAAGQPTEPIDVVAADARVETLRIRLTQLGHRPMGPATRYQALLALLDESERADHLVGRLERTAFDGPAGAEARAVAEQTTATLRATAEGLSESDARLLGEHGLPPLAELDQAMAEHRVALIHWAVTTGATRHEVDQRADAVFAVRALAVSALAVGVNGILAAGGTVNPADLRTAPEMPATDARAPIRRLRMLAVAHFRPRSVWIRNASRAALALGSAAAIAGVVPQVRGFWVVLAVFAVLRTSATDTGSTAVRAVGGTVGGFVVAATVVHLLGDAPVVLWALLPLFAATAAAAPLLFGVAAGQASFAVLVVVLFNLIEPTGWTTALVRLESVALGAAVALVASLLFWPRGARAPLGWALSELYGAAADLLAAAARGEVAPPGRGPRSPAEVEVLAARSRVDAAFADLVNERAGEHLDYVRWSPLLATPTLARMTAGALSRLGVAEDPIDDRGETPASSGRAMAEHLDDTRHRLSGVGATLAAAVAHRRAPWSPLPPMPPTPDTGERAPHRTALDGASSGLLPWVDDEATVVRELGEVWVGDWLAVTDDALDAAARVAPSAARELQRPWWR